MSKFCAADWLVALAMSNPPAQMSGRCMGMLGAVRHGSRTWGSAKTASHVMCWLPRLLICCSLVLFTSWWLAGIKPSSIKGFFVWSWAQCHLKVETLLQLIGIKAQQIAKRGSYIPATWYPVASYHRKCSQQHWNTSTCRRTKAC